MKTHTYLALILGLALAFAGAAYATQSTGGVTNPAILESAPIADPFAASGGVSGGSGGGGGYSSSGGDFGGAGGSGGIGTTCAPCPTGYGHVNQTCACYYNHGTYVCSEFSNAGTLCTTIPGGVGILTCVGSSVNSNGYNGHTINYSISGNTVTLMNYGQQQICTPTNTPPTPASIATDPGILACLAETGWCTGYPNITVTPPGQPNPINSTSPTRCAFAIQSVSGSLSDCNSCCTTTKNKWTGWVTSCQQSCSALFNDLPVIACQAVEAACGNCDTDNSFQILIDQSGQLPQCTGTRVTLPPMGVLNTTTPSNYTCAYCCVGCPCSNPSSVGICPYEQMGTPTLNTTGVPNGSGSQCPPDTNATVYRGCQYCCVSTGID